MDQLRENTSTFDDAYIGHRLIRKNASWLFLGKIVSGFLRVLIVLYSAKVLGLQSWGAFSYALSIATFLTVLSDLGINAILTREISKDIEKKKEYISTAFFIKVTLLMILGIGFIIIANNFISIEGVAALTPVMILIFVFDSLRDLGSGISRSLERMKIEGMNNILTSFFIAVFGFIFLEVYGTNFSFALAYAIGIFIGFLLMILMLRHEIAEIFFHFKKSLVRKILLSAWPFGLLGLMGTIMINTDIFIIGWLRPITDVALYSAPQKIIQLLYVIPAIIATAFFPQLSKLILNKEKFKELFETALSVIFAISIPMTIGLIILARPIISLLGDQYFGSLHAFMILSLTIVIVFPSILISNAIFAHNKQKSFMLFALGGMVGNVVLDLLLIPVFGIEGSAVATLINQIIISIYAWHKMKAVNYFVIFRKLYKIILASVAMGVLAFVMSYVGVNVFVNIIISILIYLGFLILSKERAITVFLR